MTTEPSRSNRSISINTSLQKKNDENIQNIFLNNYKYYDENPEFKKITGKNYDLIISHKSTIPDLVIYNKVFNKNECFLEANANENNYFPRKPFYIKFKEKEKLEYINKTENNFSRGNSKEIKEIKNQEEIVKDIRDEDISNDGENEEEEDEDDRNDSLDNSDENNEIENKNIDNSYLDNNSSISNNNSMIKEFEFLKKNYNSNNNNGNSMIKPSESLNQSKTNNNYDYSFNFEEPNNISYDSYILNNINNIVDNKTDLSILSTRGGINNNINLQKMNLYNNINKEFFFSPSVQNILNNYKNEYLNIFANQMIILRQIELLKNVPNNEKINELEEQIINMSIFSKEGYILGSASNCFEIYEYLTLKILERNKSLAECKIYFIKKEKFIEGDNFYFLIYLFLSEISNIKI